MNASVAFTGGRVRGYRHFYVYSALTIGVLALCVGTGLLLTAALHALGVGGRVGSPSTSDIPLGTALLLFAVPISAIHFIVAQRGLRDPDEAQSSARHGYLALWVAIALLALLAQSIALVTMLTRTQQADTAPVLVGLFIATVVGALGAVWARTTPSPTWRQRLVAAHVVMTIAMAVAANAISTTAGEVGRMVQPRSRPGAPFVPTFEENAIATSAWIFVAASVIWLLATAWQWQWRSDRGRGFYAIVGYAIGVITLTGGVVSELSAVVQAVRGDPELLRALTNGWPALAVGVLLLLVHGGLLILDRGRNGHPVIAIDRILVSVPAIVGLGVVTGGISTLWVILINSLSTPPQFVPRDAVSQAAVATAVGLVLYIAGGWRLLKITSDERVSEVRRFSLYTIVCLALVATVIAGVGTAYQAITYLAGIDPNGGAAALRWLGHTLVGCVTLIGHALTLRSDMRLDVRKDEPAPESAPIEDPLVVLLAEVRAGNVSVEEAAARIKSR